MEFALLVLYLIEGLIFAAVALVLKKKPSKFPNVETGFHVKEAMESEEKWKYANRAAAGVCAAGAVLLMGAGILLFCLRTEGPIMMLAFFGLSAAALAGAVFLPAALLRRKFR